MSILERLSALVHRPLSPRRIAKISTLAANPFAQPDVRSRQMERLLQDGSAAALSGVLRRFDALAQGHIADEEEKTWLVDALVDKGQPTLEPLRQYIQRGSKLTYAMRAYQRIVGDAQSATFFAQVLQQHSAHDPRGAEAKVQLISGLGETAQPQQLLGWLAEAIADISDDVVQAALTVLGRRLQQDQGADEQVAGLMTQLVARLGQADSAPRVARMVLAFLAEKSWPLPAGQRQLPAHCERDYRIDDAGLVHSLRPVADGLTSGSSSATTAAEDH